MGDNTSTRRNGFTLIELVMVLVITGVLAVVAIPRMIDRKVFDMRGFYDQTMAMLHYAQKTAIAQRTHVFVNIVGNTLCLTYVADITCSDANPLDIVLNPGDGQKFSRTAATGITLSTTASSFYFSALGKPSPDAQVQLTISGDGITRIITVERETGYVH
ncbi:pilus assembly FimT family protein [Glaciimonas sp. GG7]